METIFLVIKDAALSIIICVLMDKIMKGDSYKIDRLILIALLFLA